MTLRIMEAVHVLYIKLLINHRGYESIKIKNTKGITLLAPMAVKIPRFCVD